MSVKKNYTDLSIYILCLVLGAFPLLIVVKPYIMMFLFAILYIFFAVHILSPFLCSINSDGVKQWKAYHYIRLDWNEVNRLFIIGGWLEFVGSNKKVYINLDCYDDPGIVYDVIKLHIPHLFVRPADDEVIG